MGKEFKIAVVNLEKPSGQGTESNERRKRWPAYQKHRTQLEKIRKRHF